MNISLPEIWDIAEKHGPEAALKTLELSITESRIASEFGSDIARKAALCVSLYNLQEALSVRAEKAENELNESADSLNEERNDRLTALMFPA